MYSKASTLIPSQTLGFGLQNAGFPEDENQYMVATANIIIKNKRASLYLLGLY